MEPVADQEGVAAGASFAGDHGSGADEDVDVTFSGMEPVADHDGVVSGTLCLGDQGAGAADVDVPLAGIAPVVDGDQGDGGEAGGTTSLA